MWDCRGGAQARGVLAGAIVCAGCLPAGCWPGWMEMFETVPSREHRVEDLRVLAIDVEPASIVVPASMAYGDGADAVSLRIRPRIFDPRGGAVAMGVSLCAAYDTYGECVGAGIDVVQTTVRADADKPLGAVDADVEVTLDRTALEQLWADVEQPFPSLAQIAVLLNVSVVREIEGGAERELAVLPLSARVDPSDALVPDEDIDDVGMVRCASLDLDVVCGGSQLASSCGDSELDPGEACDPPAIDLCSDDCQSIAICPIGLPRVCARPALPNQRPRLLGLMRSAELFGQVFDVTPDIEPGARIRASRGERLSLVPVLASADQESHPYWMGTYFVDEEDGPLPDAPRAADVEGGCPALTGFGCPTTEVLGVRWYIADGAAEIVQPDDGFGTGYVGNSSSSIHGITIALGDEAGAEPLVVVLGDGAGGMSTTSFIIDVE